MLGVCAVILPDCPACDKHLCQISQKGATPLSQHDNRHAIKYILAIYAFFSAYIFYFFLSFGKFLGQHVVPEGSLFSVAHPRFSLANGTVAGVLTVVAVLLFAANQSVRSYLADVGDEMTRISWASFAETRKSVGMVIVIVAVASSLLFVMDVVFIKLMNAFLATAQ